MSRSRVRRREELRAAVEGGAVGFAETLRQIVATLRALTKDATAAPSQRVHGRLWLRRELLKALREAETMLDAAMAPPAAEPGDPAGNGGAGPTH